VVTGFFAVAIQAVIAGQIVGDVEPINDLPYAMREGIGW
jgi:hypothetical protein